MVRWWIYWSWEMEAVSQQSEQVVKKMNKLNKSKCETRNWTTKQEENQQNKNNNQYQQWGESQ